MAIYNLFFEQKIPQPVEVIWDFIADPRNLRLITPPDLHMEIISKNLPPVIHPGLIISYTIRPVWGINTLWLTEVKHLKENEYFVDEQRAGPYKLWHHLHKLTPCDGYVLMSDVVTYQPPYGFLGSIANAAFIRNKLGHIFEYRRETLERKFGKVE